MKILFNYQCHNPFLFLQLLQLYTCLFLLCLLPPRLTKLIIFNQVKIPIAFQSNSKIALPYYFTLLQFPHSLCPITFNYVSTTFYIKTFWPSHSMFSLTRNLASCNSLINFRCETFSASISQHPYDLFWGNSFCQVGLVWFSPGVGEEEKGFLHASTVISP